MYIVAEHKGHPLVVAAKGRIERRNRLRGEGERGDLEKEPLLFGDDLTRKSGGDSDDRKCSDQRDLTSD